MRVEESLEEPRVLTVVLRILGSCVKVFHEGIVSLSISSTHLNFPNPCPIGHCTYISTTYFFHQQGRCRVSFEHQVEVCLCIGLSFCDLNNGLQVNLKSLVMVVGNHVFERRLLDLGAPDLQQRSDFLVEHTFFQQSQIVSLNRSNDISVVTHTRLLEFYLVTWILKVFVKVNQSDIGIPFASFELSWVLWFSLFLGLRGCNVNRLCSFDHLSMGDILRIGFDTDSSSLLHYSLRAHFLFLVR